MQISTKENIDGKIQYHTKSRLQYLQNGRKVVSNHHLGQRCGEGSLPEFGGILEVQYATLMVEERSLMVVEPTTYVGGG